MIHLKEFLNYKRVNINEVLTSFCEITEKVDGNAFQIFNNDKQLIFGKRSSSAYKPSANLLTDIDLLTNSLYYNVYTYLNNYKDILTSYKILNFEIFSDDVKHIIQYDNNYKNNIMLLSGMDKDGRVLTQPELNELGNKLNISCRNILFSGVLSDDILYHISEYKDDDEKLWNYITTILNNNKFIEGLVFSFKEFNRDLKIQNPKFHQLIMEHLNDEVKEKESINLEEYYDLVIDNSYIDDEDKDKTITYKLLKLYLNLEKKNLENAEKNLKNVYILKKTEINTILIKEIYDSFPDDIKYPALLNFILFGFRHKRKRSPLWCSNEYQDSKLNKFIDKLLNN